MNIFFKRIVLQGDKCILYELMPSNWRKQHLYFYLLILDKLVFISLWSFPFKNHLLQFPDVWLISQGFHRLDSRRWSSSFGLRCIIISIYTYGELVVWGDGAGRTDHDYVGWPLLERGRARFAVETGCLACIHEKGIFELWLQACCRVGDSRRVRQWRSKDL